MDRLKHVEEFASELIREYAPHFSFGFNTRKSSLGLCRYRTKEIQLSKYHALHSKDEDIIDTILHEIAHALVGAGHGHNHVWKAKCREIGARPQRCSKEPMQGTGNKYEFKCACCNKSYPRYRKPKRVTGYRCGICKSPVTFHEVENGN